MKTEEVKEILYDYISTVPNFIDGKYPMDQRTWDITFFGSEIITILIHDKVFTYKQLLKISKDFNNVLEELIHLNHQVEVYAYYDYSIKMMIKLCEKQELFESCTNLDNFYKMNFLE